MSNNRLLSLFETEFNREQDLKAVAFANEKERFKLMSGIRNDALTIGEYTYNLVRALGGGGSNKPIGFYQMALEREGFKEPELKIEDMADIPFNGL